MKNMYIIDITKSIKSNTISCYLSRIVFVIKNNSRIVILFFFYFFLGGVVHPASQKKME